MLKSVMLTRHSSIIRACNNSSKYINYLRKIKTESALSSNKSKNTSSSRVRSISCNSRKMRAPRIKPRAVEIRPQLERRARTLWHPRQQPKRKISYQFLIINKVPLIITIIVKLLSLKHLISKSELQPGSHVQLRIFKGSIFGY